MSTSFPALDVAIGLSFAYFLFSELEAWLKGMFASPDRSGEKYEEFLETPIMRALMQSVGRPGGTRAASSLPPAYIPSPHFVAAALCAGRKTEAAGEAVKDASQEIDSDIRRLEGTIVGDALREVYDRAAGDVVRF